MVNSTRHRNRRALLVATSAALLVAPPLVVAWVLFNVTVELENGGTLGLLGDSARAADGAWVEELYWLASVTAIGLDLAIAYLVYRIVLSRDQKR